MNSADNESTVRQFLKANQVDMDFNERAFWLVSNQTTWIKRRMESIDFEHDGSTRRRIAFDFAIPESKILSGSTIGACEKDDDAVAVPLTFMRKGSLTKLHTMDAGGSIVPSIGFVENGRILIGALTHLYYLVEEGFEAAGLGFKTLTFEGGNPEPIQKAPTVFKHIVYSVVGSDWRTTPPPAPAPDTEKSGDRQRFELFERLRENLLDPEKSADVEAIQHDSTEMDQLIQVLNNSVKSLAEIGTDRREDLKPKLEALLILLATACESYTFALLVPKELAESRSFLEVSYTTGVVMSPLEYKPRFSWLKPRLLRLLWRESTAQQAQISFNSYGAASTHVEITPPLGSEVALFYERSATKDGKNQGEAVAPVSDKGTPPWSWPPRAASLSGRKFPRIVHVDSVSRRKQSVTNLTLCFVPPREVFRPMIGWVLVATVAAIFALIAATRGAPGNSDAIEAHPVWAVTFSYFRPENVLAISALLAAMLAVVTVNEARHEVVDLLHRSIRARVKMSFAIVVLAAIVVSIAGSSAEIEDSRLGKFEISVVLGSSLFVCAAILGLHVVVTTWRHRKIQKAERKFESEISLSGRLPAQEKIEMPRFEEPDISGAGDAAEVSADPGLGATSKARAEPDRDPMPDSLNKVAET